MPLQAEIPGLLHQVHEFLEHQFHVHVFMDFPFPLGLGLFQFENAIQHKELLDASPINFGQWVLTVHKHDEAVNFQSHNYIKESCIIFLGFPLDYQLQDYIQVVVAPFGRLIHWYDGPNKSRIITKCLLLSLEHVP